MPTSPKSVLQKGPCFDFMHQKHALCVQIDTLARIVCVQSHDLCSLDTMTHSGYNAALFIKMWPTKIHTIYKLIYKPVSQSCVVAKSGIFWQVTGQSNLAYKWLAATKISKVSFSYSHRISL